jgi:hypothetical protein
MVKMILVSFSAIVLCLAARQSFGEEMIERLLPVTPDTIDLPPFFKEMASSDSTSVDTLFIKTIDTALHRCGSIRDAYRTFKKFIPQAAKKGLTARLFIAFHDAPALSKLKNDTIAYQWYCKKWRADALAVRDDFLRMCYSDCFFEGGAFGPAASPIVDTNGLGSKKNLRIGLFLRDRKRRIKLTYEFSRLTFNVTTRGVAFETIKKGSLYADSANWFTRIKVDNEGAFRIIMHTSDNYRAYYFSTGSLRGMVLCDNRTLLINGFSPSNRLRPPYTVYVLNRQSFIQSETDSNGFCALAFRNYPDSLIEVRVWIEKNGLLAPLEVSHNVIDERNKTGSFVYCDRTWYRPGDTVHIGGMVKNFTDDSRFAKSSVDSVHIEITSEVTGNKIARTAHLDSFGHYYDSLPIPATARLESYRIVASIPSRRNDTNSKDASTEFEVAVYKKPACRVSVSTDKPVYFPHDTITERIAARFLLGAPMRYASASLLALYNSYTLDTLLKFQKRPRYRYLPAESKSYLSLFSVEDTVVDKNGALTKIIPVDAMRKNGYITLMASVRGQDKRYYGASRKIFVASDTPLINIYKRFARRSGSLDLFISCFVTDVQGYPCTGAVTCMLDSAETLSEGAQTIKTDPFGVARFCFRGLRIDKKYRALYVLNKDRPNAAFDTLDIDIPERFRSVKDKECYIFTDRSDYKKGDTAIATILFPYDSSPVLFTVGTTNTRLYKTAFSGKPLVFAIPLDQCIGPILFLSAACFNKDNNELKTTHEQIKIAPDSSLLLKVNLSSSRQVNPGDTYSLKLSITDRTGAPAKASFSAAVVDEAVFAIEPENDSGLLHSLVPKSYRYPCSTFSSTVPDLRENLRTLESLETHTLLVQGHPKKIKMKVRFGQSQRVFTQDVRSWSDEVLCEFMDCIASGGFGKGTDCCRGLDDLIGGLMGGGDGGGLELKKRGSLVIAAPDYLKGGSLISLNATPVRQYFRDQACWFPSIKTTDSGQACFDFKLPDNLTQWRIRLRGSDGGSYLVDFSDSLKANKPLMIQLEVPPFFIKGDSALVHAVIFNNTVQRLTAMVDLETSRGIRVTGESGKKISLVPNDITVIEWPALAQDGDSAVFIATVTSPNFSDGEKRTIPVKNYFCDKRIGASKLVRDSCLVPLDVPADVVKGSKTLNFYASGDPIRALLPALQYLMEFPHGCVEQTMNRFLPDLYVAQILSVNGIKDEKIDAAFKKCLPEGLLLLHNYQHADGGWGWWNNDKTSQKMTALVIKGLYLALRTPLDDASKKSINKMLEKGIPRVLAMIDSCKSDTIAMVPLLNSMAHSPLLKEKRGDIQNLAEKASSLTALQCAELLECTHMLHLGKYDTLLIRKIEAKANREGGMVWWQELKAGNSRTDWKETSVYMTAAILNILASIHPGHPDVLPTLAWLYSKQDGQKWICTATTAEVIRAISACFLKTPDKTYSSSHMLNITLNGNRFQVPVIAGMKNLGLDNGLTIADSLLQIRNNLSIHAPNGKSVYCFVGLRYGTRVPSSPDSQLPIQISRAYYRIDDLGKMGTSRYLMDGRCNSGDLIEVTIALTTAKLSKFIMVEDPIPAGMEMIPETGALANGTTHCEYRPDKALFYFETLPKGTTTLTYRFRAIFPGCFRVLPVHAESMYVPEITGYSCGDLMKITK